MEEKTINSQELMNVLRSMKDEDELFYFFLRTCENGNLQLCQMCLDAGADINIYEHFHHQPLLKVLVSSGKFTTKVADWLIEKGADINITGYGNFTPLTTACYNGELEIAKYFIDKGIKIRQYKKDGDTSDLYYAVGGGNYEIVRLLLEAGADLEADVRYEDNPFIRAVEEKKSNIVELFLQKGVSPNFYLYGSTPLHNAVAERDTEIARLLLEYNANVNAKLQDSCSFIKEYLAVNSIDIAIFNQDIAMQKLLLEFGGTISSKEEKIKALTMCCEDEEISPMIKKVLAS